MVGRPWVYVKLPYLYDIYVVILENIVWYFLDALEVFEVIKPYRESSLDSSTVFDVRAHMLQL